MPSQDLILAIDNGTQSLKALVFDRQGQLQARAQVVFDPYVSPKPGWAEQDPELFWTSLCSACRQLWDRNGVNPKAIAGVALTTQRGTVVNVDPEGRPLRPAIIWPDQRKTRGLPPLTGPWRWLFGLGGLSRTVNYLRSEAEANWIAAHQPDIWQKTYKYLFLSGFLTHKLTGRFNRLRRLPGGLFPF